MKIFSPSHTQLYDIQADDRSVRYRSIMNDDSLTLHFSQAGTVTIPLGSYVDYEGQRYTLFYPENFKKHNTRNFEYTLVLHGNRELLKRFKFKDTAAIPYRLKFSLMAKPVDFITRIVQNMNLHDSGWAVGDCIDATEKLISFNHESCFDVLGRLASEFSTEWEIEGKTIHLRKVEKFKADPLALSYGKGNGFKSGTGRMNDGDKIPIGRLYVQGGERNIDFASYGSASLLLPRSATLVYEGKTYRTDAEGMSITRDGNTNIGEDSYDGSDIYPKWTGIVSEVIAVDASKNLYDIKDFTIPYSLNFRDCRIPGEKATIVFQSGILAGREFDIEQTDTDLTGYIHAERRFKLVPQEQDGMVMPGGAFIPAVEDKYAVFNIRMPQAYISVDATKTGASWDLFREAVKYFSENEAQKFQFTGELDGVWSKSRWLQIGGKIVPGGHVLFSDPQFLPGGEVIRIVSVKDYVNSPHKPEITLSNAPISGSFSSGLAKLEAEEVVIEQNRRGMIRFAQRQWRDTKETQAMLEQSLLNFSGSINPVTIKTMQLIAGDESLQFRFVNSKTTPVRVDHDITFNASTKVLTAAAGIIQHMTLGITEMSTKNRVKTYKFWDISGYTSPALTSAEIPYYLYLKCNKTGTSGTYVLSETAIGMESVTGFYHFLVGIVNSEQGGDRSFAPVYGFTEILPGRITTDRIVSQDGNTFFDLLNGIIGGKISFTAGSSGLANLSEWAAAAQSIQDAQNTANQAAIDAENAIQEAMNNVTDYNAKFATLQQQVDGEVNNWFYAYTPTPSNYPASEWTTNAIRDRHIGDTFTNTQAYVSALATPDAGKSWRYVKNAGTYSWTPIADSDAVKALLEAATAQSTADGKSTTYLTQPVKYSAGDTWVLATDTTINSIAYKAGDILTASQNSTSFNQAHWSKKVRYTDDTAATAAQVAAGNAQNTANQAAIDAENAIQEAMNNVTDYNAKFARLQQQVDGEVNNWFYAYTPTPSNYPASDWTTNAIRDRHIGDTFTNTQAYVSALATPDAGKSWRYVKNASTYGWTPIADSDAVKALLEAATAQSTADGKSTTYLTQPVKYSAGDTWVLGAAWNGFKAGDILTATQSSSTFVAAHWIKRVRYTDDTTANEAKQLAIDTQNNLNSTNETVNALDSEWGIITKDGIISEAEAKAIEKYKNIINTEKAGLEAQYNKLYTNIYLSGTAKSNLLNAKISYSGAVDNLLLAIDTAIADGATTPAEKALVDTRFSQYRTALASFQSAVEDANKAIQDAIKAIADGAATAASDAVAAANISKAITDKFGTTVNGGLVQSVMMLLRALDSQIETAGINGIQGDGTLPAFWSGGTYAEAISGIAKKIDRHDGSGHLAGGNLWWNALGELFFGKAFDSKTIVITPTGNIPTLAEIGNKEKYALPLVNSSIYKDFNNPSHTGTVSDLYVSYMPEFELVNDAILTINTEVEYSWGSGLPQFGADGSIKLQKYNGTTWIDIQYGAPSYGNGYYSYTLNIENVHVLSGKYRIHAQFLCGGETPSGANATVSLLKYFDIKYQLKVKKLVIASDGIAFLDSLSDNYFRLSLQDSTPLIYRGGMDIPGVLASGSVASNGAQNNVWGAKANAGSATPISGGFTVPLSNMTSGNYVVQITPHTNTTFRIGAKAAANFTVYGSGGFDYVVIGKN